LAEIALKFGPAEYFSLMVLGLVASIVLASGSLLHALGMIVLGLLLGLVGTDVNSGTARYSFGVPELADGISFVTVAMGVFRVRRDHRQPGARGNAQRADGEGQGTDAHARRLGKDHRADPARNVIGGSARHPARRRRDAGVVLGLRAGKRKSRRIPRISARARSKAWRRRKPPTTPVRKRRSFRC
jgi:hypothetical protein